MSEFPVSEPEVVIPLEPAKPDKNKSPCENLRDRSQGVTDWVPKCEADGKYARQQCSLVTEKFRTYYLCWCVDMNGLEINGTKLEYDDYPQDTESCDFGRYLVKIFVFVWFDSLRHINSLSVI